jgi:hypothetical protein
LKITNERIADAIIKVREGKVKYIAGYDGVYGRPVFDEEEFKKHEEEQKNVKIHTQKRLIDFFNKHERKKIMTIKEAMKY